MAPQMQLPHVVQSSRITGLKRQLEQIRHRLALGRLGAEVPYLAGFHCCVWLLLVLWQLRRSEASSRGEEEGKGCEEAARGRESQALTACN